LESDMAGDDWTPNHLAVWLKCVCIYIIICIYIYCILPTAQVVAKSQKSWN
jgi:hypothetical protein